MIFDKILKAFEQFDFEKEVEKGIELHFDYMLYLNKKQLFSESIQSDGKKVYKIRERFDSWYAYRTQQIYDGETFTFDGETKRKIAGEPYHLLATGQWFNSFKVIKENENYIVDGVKVDKLGKVVDMEKNFGEEIYGLTEQSTILFNQKVKENIDNEIEKFIKTLPKI